MTYAHPEGKGRGQRRRFCPVREALFIKDPGIGAAVSRHQDGVTHWDSDDFDEDIHGTTSWPIVEAPRSTAGCPAPTNSASSISRRW